MFRGQGLLHGSIASSLVSVINYNGGDLSYLLRSIQRQRENTSYFVMWTHFLLALLDGSAYEQHTHLSNLQNLLQS